MAGKDGNESNKSLFKDSRFIRKFSTHKSVYVRKLLIKNKDKDEDISYVYLSLGLFVVVIFPISGFIIFCIMKNIDKEYKAYKWAFRALTLGSALCVIYAYIICSVYYTTKAFSFKGDKLGYSFT